MMKRALAMLFSVWATHAFAAEEILSFHSDIAVHSNGSMTVTETIAVRAENDQIKRGIYRDFPTRYKDAHGNRYSVSFDVTSVTRGREPEPHHLKRLDNGTRVYIGQKDYTLPKGEYVYTLTYTTDRQLGNFDQHDELYWNVTGTDWAFPILRATATVVLPGSVPVDSIRHEGYTGKMGARGRDYRATVDANGHVHFESTRRLAPREGLTLVVGWEKGHVHQPSAVERAQLHLRDNPVIFVATIGAFALFMFCFIVWVIVGRDPAKGTTIPRFAPPEGVSPAAARFVMNMGYDPKCFAAAIISLAVKERITLSEQNGTYSISRLNAKYTGRSAGERAVHDRLLGTRRKITFKRAHQSTIKRAMDGLKEALKHEYDEQIFRTNQRFLIPALIIMVLTFLMFFIVAEDSDVWGMGMWLSMWSVAVYFLVVSVVRAWRNVSRTGVGNAIVSTLFALPFIAGEIFVAALLARKTSIIALLILAGMVFLLVGFRRWMKAPTRMGRKLMDQLEGFRMYLSVGETDRLAAMKGPERTPELFETFLPYALALDVEQAWAESFSDVLAHAARHRDGDYSPRWYQSDHSSMSMDRFTRSIGDSLASSVKSSSIPVSSGSRGGSGFSSGSSGGGGGGGGGGGW